MASNGEDRSRGRASILVLWTCAVLAGLPDVAWSECAAPGPHLRGLRAG